MRAAVIDKPFSVSLQQVSVPSIQKANEVKIRVMITGICGSEIHAYHGTHPFRIPPVISGHELAGEVVEVGSEVKSVSPGDRVTVEPHYGCGTCSPCKMGNYNICDQKKVLGTQEWIGSFGEFIVVPEETILKLSDDISYEQGALIEPIAVGVHAVRKAKINAGENIAILGAGPIGLGIVLAAKKSNVSKIFITDAVNYNLDIAKKLGATASINIAVENATEKILNETNGDGVDTVFIAVGLQSVMDEAFRIVKRGGKISEIALFGKKPEIDIACIQSKEIQLIGSNMYIREDFEIAKEIIASNQFATSLLISKVVPIEEIKKAMKIVDEKVENVVKVLLKF